MGMYYDETCLLSAPNLTDLITLVFMDYFNETQSMKVNGEQIEIGNAKYEVR